MDGGSKVTNEHEEKGEEVESKSQKEDHVSEVKERNSMESKFQELWIEFSKDKTALTKVEILRTIRSSSTWEQYSKKLPLYFILSDLDSWKHAFASLATTKDGSLDRDEFVSFFCAVIVRNVLSALFRDADTDSRTELTHMDIVGILTIRPRTVECSEFLESAIEIIPELERLKDITIWKEDFFGLETMKDGKIALDEFVDFFATIVGPLGAYDVSLPNLTESEEFIAFTKKDWQNGYMKFGQLDWLDHGKLSVQTFVPRVKQKVLHELEPEKH